MAFTGGVDAVAATLAATLDEGDAVTITETMLKITDVDDMRDEVVYILTGLPVYARSGLTAPRAGVGDTFTNQDIADGILTYDYDGSENFTDLVSPSPPMTVMKTAARPPIPSAA